MIPVICSLVLLLQVYLSAGQSNKELDAELAKLSEVLLVDSSFENHSRYIELLIKKKDKGVLKRYIPRFTNRFGALPEAEIVTAMGLGIIGKTEAASAILEKRYERTKSIEDLLILSRILVENGARLNSESVIAKIIFIDSSCAEAYYLRSRNALSTTVLDRLINRKERGAAYSDAYESIKDAMKFDSLNPLYAGFAVLLLDSMRQIEQACSLCTEKSDQVGPNNYFDKICGHVYFRVGLYEMALSHFERAYLDLSSDINNLLSIEAVHKRLGTYSEYYLTGQERLADAMPETLSIRYNLALEYLKRDSLVKAESAFRKVLAADSLFAEAKKGLMAVLAKMGNFSESAKYSAKNSFTEGQLLLFAGDTAGAISIFENVVAFNPNEIKPAYFLATHYFNLGKWDKVVEYVGDPERFTDKDGARFMAGTALYKQKRESARAYALLVRCEGGVEDGEQLCAMLAELAFTLKKYDEAVARFEKCHYGYETSVNSSYYLNRIKEIGRLR